MSLELGRYTLHEGADMCDDSPWFKCRVWGERVQTGDCATDEFVSSVTWLHRLMHKTVVDTSLDPCSVETSQCKRCWCRFVRCRPEFCLRQGDGYNFLVSAMKYQSSGLYRIVYTALPYRVVEGCSSGTANVATSHVGRHLPRRFYTAISRVTRAVRQNFKNLQNRQTRRQ